MEFSERGSQQPADQETISLWYKEYVCHRNFDTGVGWSIFTTHG